MAFNIAVISEDMLDTPAVNENLGLRHCYLLSRSVKPPTEDKEVHARLRVVKNKLNREIFKNNSKNLVKKGRKRLSNASEKTPNKLKVYSRIVGEVCSLTTAVSKPKINCNLVCFEEKNSLCLAVDMNFNTVLSASGKHVIKT